MELDKLNDPDVVFYEEEQGEEKDEERMKWSKNCDFMLSFIGYTVGLSNILRFPYLCANNGGAVFLIPYAVFMVLFGFPLTFMELSLGQFTGKSAYDVWDICPALRGVGVAMNGISALFGLYYITNLSWILYYLVHSFMSPLPWTTCDNWWNSDNCVLYLSGSNNRTNLTININDTQLNTSMITVDYFTNSTANQTLYQTDRSTLSTPTEEFWNYNMLRISKGLDDFGSMQWHLVVSLAVSWLIIFLCVIKGVKSVGKVVYVTAIAPYILITIIFIRAVTLPGALKGIEYYVIPDFHRLADVQVWVQALLQIFFSMGIGWGALVTMASYNKFESNVHRNSLVFCIVGEGTSFFAGFAVFSVLGFIAHQTGLEVADVVRTGPGLAFITYPEALSQLPVPQLWSVLFFVMLLCVALDSMFMSVEVCITAIVDLFPKATTKLRILVTGITCIVMFLGSLVYTTQAGIYAFQLVDWYMAAISVFLITFLECIVIGWIYGANRFMDDIALMLGNRPSMVVSFLWRYITPILLVTVFIFTLNVFELPTYGDYHYPAYASHIGWTIAAVTSIPIPIWLIKEMVVTKGPLLQRIKTSFQPNENWGPSKDYKQTVI